ncbi:MAG: hypothetical protein IT373_17655 [Polyangiaceae bacterium]|nr:hypothetical protein [Polyangiaceae bacterium]
MTRDGEHEEAEAGGDDREPDDAPAQGAGLDRELALLPKPHRPLRTASLVAVALVTVVAALTAWSLRGEAFYALRESAPLDLGDLAEGELPRGLADHYVRGHGVVELARAVRYRRVGEADVYRLAPVAGTDKLWVELRVPEQYDTPRYLPPESLSGRLVPASGLGLRYRGVASALERAGATPDSWVLVEGHDPDSARWVFLLFVLSAGFGLWGLAAAVRILRRIPAR